MALPIRLTIGDELVARKVVVYQRDTAFPAQILLDAGWAVLIASDAQSVKRLIEEHAVSIGIACLGNASNVNFSDLEELATADTPIEWVTVVSRASLRCRECLQFISNVCHDYHTLPIDPERLLATLGHAYGKAIMKVRLEKSSSSSGFLNMLGTSQMMRELYRNLRKMAWSGAPVLITGENGTGKELAANALHQLSRRAKGPLVAVNCGALPSQLIQSELFGYEKGAFTGAATRKIGRIEAAVGGTIFLDEIGDLSLDIQVNLLRFLQERTIERIGSNTRITVDVRVVAATNANLERAVESGKFREDLYYRINVLRLDVPSLKEREGDIELLAQSYFEKFRKEHCSPASGFSKAALRVMNNHSWPGNVRELINRIRRATILSENKLITPADIGLEKRAPQKPVFTLDIARTCAEEEVIRVVLRKNHHNVSESARQLGVSRATLYRRIREISGGVGTEKNRL
jgi:DNA-binding NtrC family response regulator